VSYLSEIGEALRQLVRRYDVRVRVIGAPRYRIEGVPVINVPWQLDTEVEELVSCDMGIMPLRDDAYSRGKCGAKLLQYMGVGIPAVASPVGANREIIEQGKTGFLARTESEWEETLGQLIMDASLRRELGQAGRERVEHDYALSDVAARLIGFFREFA
jgi:glycosyltransferase involved in cell wall biosynthesis